MSEASKPKYDSLPGIDTAPDVYETPELAEDVSTIQASTAASESEGEDDSDKEASKVHHQRLQTDQARHRFQPSRVDAHNVDFSDNISGQHRRSYRTSTRAQRRRGEIIGDDSDEEEESFERKLARVRQEALELEQEHTERMRSGDKTKTEERDSKEIMEFISDKVDSIYTQRRGGDKNSSSAEHQLSATMQRFNNYAPFAPSPRITKALANQPPLPGSQIQRSQLDHVLSQASSFDARLTQLEQTLGLNGSTMPDIGTHAPLPIFATLERIEESLGLMTDASSGTLEAASSQIRRLIAEAEHLQRLRSPSSPSRPSSPSPSSQAPPTPQNPDASPLTPAQISKINALHGTLPSLDKLTPILPLILDRLRTLRLVHTAAHQADAVLADLEARQTQQADEIRRWGEKLAELEKEVRGAEERVVSKAREVGEVVGGIEARVAGLG